MILIGIVYAAFHGTLPVVTSAVLDSAKEAVMLCITMLGAISFWTGLMKIAENAGVSGEIVVGKVMESTDYNFGYNAQTGEYVDMMAAGIIDPAKVVKTAIAAAASTAGVMLTTGAVMTEIPEEKVNTQQMPGGMPGMM